MSGSWKHAAHEWLQTHHGVIGVEQLDALGCSRRTAYRLVTSGDFALIMPAVLVSTHWPIGPLQLSTAACVRHPLAVIDRISAARHWHFRGLHRDDDVSVPVPHGSSPTLPGVTVHRTRALDRADIVHLDDGRRVTSPSRTLFDCADILGRQRTASVLEQLINDRHGTFATHAATLRRLGTARRPGTRTFAAAIASRPAWSAAMQSELELLILTEIRRQGLPEPSVQMWLTLPDGDRIRLDFAWPDRRVVLEVDHPFWHAGADASARDKRRDRRAATIGWQTLRITDLEVHASIAIAVSDVAKTLRIRAA